MRKTAYLSMAFSVAFVVSVDARFGKTGQLNVRFEAGRWAEAQGFMPGAPRPFSVSPAWWGWAKLASSLRQLRIQTVDATVNALKEKFSRGVNDVVAICKEMVGAIKEVNCEDFVGAASKLNTFIDPINRILAEAFPANMECLTEFQKGFICAVPQGVRDIVVLGSASVAYAWENRQTCLAPSMLLPLVASGPSGLSSTGIGFSICGLGYFLADEWDRFKCVWQSMVGNPRFVLLVKALVKVACNLAGQALFDFVLGALTGGTSLTTTIPMRIQAFAKRVSKVKDIVDIGQKLSFLSKPLQEAVNQSTAILKEVENQVTAAGSCVKSLR